MISSAEGARAADVEALLPVWADVPEAYPQPGRHRVVTAAVLVSLGVFAVAGELAAPWGPLGATSTGRSPAAAIESKVIVAVNEDVGGEASSWQCVRYDEGIDDEWCQSAGQQGGFEYKWVGPVANLCGECWCCNKALPPAEEEVVVAEPPTCSHNGEDCRTSRCCTDRSFRCVEWNPFWSQCMSPEEQQESTAPWECHNYEDDQDDEWCKTAGRQGDYKYQFVGPESDFCTKKDGTQCWCCEQDQIVATPKPEVLSQQCIDLSGKYVASDGGADTFIQSGCSGNATATGWRYTVSGHDAATRHDGATGAIRGRTGHFTIVWSDGVNYTQQAKAAAAPQMPVEWPEPNCAKVGKCQQLGHQCYEKNETYSACKVTCHANGWSCKEIGHRTPVHEKGGTECAWGEDPCAPLGCCVAEGLQCYERDEYWSGCLGSCQPTMDFGSGPEKWTCTKFGDRKQVELGCTWMNEECTTTKLCCHEGMQCVQKNQRAYCTYDSKMLGWNGTVLGGARSEWEVQPVPKGATNASGTTLFCFMAVMADTKEDQLVNAAKKIGASIFACDAHGIYSSWQPEDDGESNTRVFVKVWQEVKEDGRFTAYDWTVKVDPDAVFLPHGLKQHLLDLRAPKWWPVYIKNTQKGIGFSGACEVLSNGAINKYFAYARECATTRSGHMGEDTFMKRCMDMIGAGSMFIDGLVETIEPGASCKGKSESVVFHPLQDVEAWKKCQIDALDSHPIDAAAIPRKLEV